MLCEGTERGPFTAHKAEEDGAAPLVPGSPPFDAVVAGNEAGLGGVVLFGPAGRPLPQLPLRIVTGGALEAAGNFSGPVGPSWWGVRMGEAT